MYFLCSKIGLHRMKHTFLLFAFYALFLGACAVKPVARFSAAPEKLVAPATVAFSNNSLNAETYSWDFGDGASSAEAAPLHRYAHSGNYTVTLKAVKGAKTVTHKQMIQVTAPTTCLLEIETSQGVMMAELFAGTPQHRDNFVKLAEEGYFDDLLFHRVIGGFMIQGGDPNSRNAPAGQALGFGGPSYKIPAEFVDSLVHVKGMIAAARDGNPQKASSGSQFYIVQGAPVSDQTLDQVEASKGFRYTSEQREAYKKLGGTPHLDRDYTVFGRIVEGLDVLDKIAAQPTDRSNRPLQDVKMKIKVIK
jgi:peptidyl-prolyl cis-trans isomerase B (cyclophilin B)